MNSCFLLYSWWDVPSLPSFLQPVDYHLLFMDDCEFSWELQDFTLTSGVSLPQPRSLL